MQRPFSPTLKLYARHSCSLVTLHGFTLQLDFYLFRHYHLLFLCMERELGQLTKRISIQDWLLNHVLVHMWNPITSDCTQMMILTYFNAKAMKPWDQHICIKETPHGLSTVDSQLTAVKIFIYINFRCDITIHGLLASWNILISANASILWKHMVESYCQDSTIEMNC